MLVFRCPRLLPVVYALVALLAAVVRAVPLCEDSLVGPVVESPGKLLPPCHLMWNHEKEPSRMGIDCSNARRSSFEIGNCPQEKKAASVKVRNAGRIDIVVFFLQPDGALKRSFSLRPGFQRRIGHPTCVGHQWIVQSMCGHCMAQIEVSSTQQKLVKVNNDGIESACTGQSGRWSSARKWQNRVVAAGLANVPGNNRVLGFSSVQPGSFSLRKPETSPKPRGMRTRAEIYDYVSDTFHSVDLEGHHMFCAALTFLPDGRLLAQGGGDGEDSKFVSTFNPFQGTYGTWTRHENTENGHWYGTAVVSKEQNVLLALGVDKKEVGFDAWADFLNFPEMSNGFNFSTPWRNMTGIDMDEKQPDNLHFYPVMHLMPNGDILESGTMNKMWRINTTGTGSITFAGERSKERAEKEAWGASTIMFDEGRLLTIGGIENFGTSDPLLVYKRALVIDMNNANSIKTWRTEDLHDQRAFANTVVLPSGEVAVIGGKNSFVQWNDTLSLKAVELWNPSTGKWTLLAEQQAPRNYHATAILLRDGRIMSAGGGLCAECDVLDANGKRLNQPTHEIFSPPYLFDRAGKLKPRPVILQSPSTTRANQTIRIVAIGRQAKLIRRVSVVKQHVVTHTLSTDARQLRLRIIGRSRVTDTKYVYRVQSHPNPNVMTPGYWFLFVLDRSGTPSIAADLRMIVSSKYG